MHRIIKIPISHEMLKTAEKYAKSLGSLKGSLVQGRANVIGFLGEEMFQSLFPKAKRVNNFDYDFESSGKKIDVKTVSFNNDPRRGSLRHMVVPHTKSQYSCDYFVGAGVHKSLSHGLIYGWIGKDEFFRCSELIVAGSRRDDGLTQLATGNRVTIDKLHSFPPFSGFDEIIV